MIEEIPYGTICKGSYNLGSACTECARCHRFVLQWMDCLLLHGWTVKIRETLIPGDKTVTHIVEWRDPTGLSGSDYQSESLTDLPRPVIGWIQNQPRVPELEG